MKHTFNKREDDILNSLDGIQPAAVPPYFYTRLVARMENELLKKAKPFFLLRPAFLTVSLSVLLMINIVFLFQFNRQDKNSSIQQGNRATIESFADAYGLNTKTVYE